MDPVTQVTLGAAAGLAAGGRKAPRASALAGGLAGFLPDLDVLIKTADPLSSILWHRHFTHALVFIPVIALLAWSPFLLLNRYRDCRRALWWAALAGAATHAPLDALTAWGTVLFWPFTNARVSIDWLPIIHPVYTFTMLGGVIFAVWKRKVWGAWFALGISALFFAVGAIQHARVLAFHEQLAEARGHQIERRRAMTSFRAVSSWRTVYQHEGRLYLDHFRVPFFSSVEHTLSSGSIELLREEAMPAELLADADSVRAFRIFSWFADGYVARVPGEGFTVGDFRYFTDATEPRSRWSIEVDPKHPRSVRRVRMP